jgi:hypothetical protein
VWLPKKRTPSPSPAENAWPPNPCGDAIETLAREVLGERDARLDRVDGVERGIRVVDQPLVRQRPMGNDDQLVPGGRFPIPACQPGQLRDHRRGHPGRGAQELAQRRHELASRRPCRATATVQ